MVNSEDSKNGLLKGLLSDDDAEITAELRSRRNQFVERRVRFGEEAALLEEGWTVVRYNKTTVRVRKPKPDDERLEDDVWSLLRLMGFKYMNEGRHFRVAVDGSEDGVSPKQIDVLAVDEDTALVVECKASAVPRNRSLQKDLNETRALQDAIRKAVHARFPERPRVIFVYATRNINWSESDEARAKANQISIIRDRQIDYFQKLITITGPAARHQFQADLLGGSEVRGLNTQVAAVRGSFGGRKFYQFVIEPDKLLKLAYVSHRAQIDDNTLGTYQRLLSKKRVLDIAAHINETGGVFPTNVVVNFRATKNLRFDAAGPAGDAPTVVGTLHLPNVYKSAFLIDGQHRLYGFARSNFAEKGRIPVLAFEGLEPAEEVRLFVEINSKQVKVPPRLIAELEPELLREATGDKQTLRRISSGLVEELNRRQSSPLQGLVAGEWDSGSEARPITRPLLRNAIERSQLLGTVRGDVFHPGDLYHRDESTTVERARAVIEQFLQLFVDGCNEHWSKGNAVGGFLCTNNGLNGLLRLLHEAIIYTSQFDANQDYWKLTPSAIIERVSYLTRPVTDYFEGADEGQVRPFRREYGSGGQSNTAFRLLQVVHERHREFHPHGLEEWMRDREQGTINRASELVRQTEIGIRSVTFKVLDSEYGEGYQNWWREAVPENIRSKAAQLAETSVDGGEPHQYLVLLDYKSIAEASKNWQHFDRVWSMDRNARSKADKLEWMIRLNAIRNRVSHTGRDQRVTPEEVGFLEGVATYVDDQVSRLSRPMPL